MRLALANGGPCPFRLWHEPMHAAPQLGTPNPSALGGLGHLRDRQLSRPHDEQCCSYSLMHDGLQHYAGVRGTEKSSSLTPFLS